MVAQFNHSAYVRAGIPLKDMFEIVGEMRRRKLRVDAETVEALMRLAPAVTAMSNSTSVALQVLSSLSCLCINISYMDGSWMVNDNS
jgi:hypothetical protein